MIGEVTQRGLPHLPRVPQLHVNRPYKKKKTLHVQHIVFYISLPLLSQRGISQLRDLWRKCCMYSKKCCWLCSFSLFILLYFFFTAAHLHLAGHQHFPFSHRRYKIFTLFFQRNYSPFLFCRSSSLSLFSPGASLACSLLSRFLCLFFLYIPNLWT